jgi:hypothetical protein
MPSRIARRVSAVLAAAALAATTGALPASAADNAADVFLVAPDVLVPVHGSGVQVSPELQASEPVTIEDSQVTFRLTGVGTAIELTGDDIAGVHCANTTLAEVVCRNSESLHLDSDGITGLFRAHLRARYDPRTEGSLEITFAGTGYGPVSQTVRVRAAEAVDLTAGPPQETSASPGDRFYTPIEVKNTGGKGITGVAVLLNSSAEITTRERPRNCFFKQGRPTACFWDKRLVWDSVYEFYLQMYVSKDAAAPGRASLQPQWLTAAEFEDYQAYLARRGLDLGQPGIDLSVPLRRVTPPSNTALVQTDLYPDDNTTSVLVNVVPRS